ncbi:MAG TPA: hypothetical protein VL443_24570 [Cyclobacteriaceae bacterium]|nr:hypothetical protein [Cyclobacteriaceae bacterium]
MKFTTILPSVFLVLISPACKDDDSKISVNLDEFEQITQPYPYAGVSTKEAVDYWELLSSSILDPLFSAGTKCANSSNEAQCIYEFNATISENTGFSINFCPLDYCFKYIRYQSKDEISLVTSVDDLIEFLGEIDTKSDAILLTTAYNYYFSTTKKEEGAIKEVKDGYEILTTQLVKFCAPIQTNRFLLKVSRNGKIEILKQEVYSTSNGCI